MHRGSRLEPVPLLNLEKNYIISISYKLVRFIQSGISLTKLQAYTTNNGVACTFPP